MMTRFNDTKHACEMACFMPITVPRTVGAASPIVCTENGLIHAYFGTPQVGREKATYYVREEKVLQVALFPSSHSSTKSQRTSTPASRKLTAMDRISLTLPYPPSVNHYWQTRVLRRGDRYVPQVYVSADGLRYQQAVAKHLDGVPRFKGRLRVQILVQPPDGRARDLDNGLKCLLDSLTKAGVWNDDQQIDSLLVVRGDQTKGGSVLVLVEPFEETNA